MKEPAAVIEQIVQASDPDALQIEAGLLEATDNGLRPGDPEDQPDQTP